MAESPTPPMPPEAQVAALAGSDILGGLAPDDVARLLDLSEPAALPAGAAVAREGESGEEMYFVLRGEVRLWRNDLALATLGPGGHFGALGLLTGRPRSVSATAATPLVLLRLGRPGWERFQAERPAAALQLMRALLAHLREELVERTDSLSLLLRGRTLPRRREVTVRLGGAERRVPTGTTLRQLLPREEGGAPVVAGLIGQKPVSLATPVFADCAVAPLTSAHWEGRHVYTRSGGLMLLEAAHAIDPDLDLRLGPSLGPAQLLEVRGSPALDRGRLAARLGAELSRLADLDIPFRHELWALEEAMAWFAERGWDGALRLLRSRPSGTVPLVSCGEVYALGMGPTLPSTGMVRGVRLFPREDGVAVDWGRSDPRHDGAAPPPGPEPEMVREHRAWLEAQGVGSVGAFNELCVSGQVSQLIRVAEGFHEKRIGRLADAIAARRPEIRIIAVAGPSSSGKTTFIKRLSVQLEIDGLHPVGLSLDDYYLDRARAPRDPDGEYDLEVLEALDLGLFRAHLGRLLSGEEVVTARYDFRTGTSRPEGGRSIRLGPGDALLLEGIHGLDPRLLGDIPRPGAVFRIFVHPATTLPFDRLARVSATDLRLLRRIIRDRHSRGYSAAQNIARWPSVQRGEQAHIFPFRREADAVFDSSLVYEPAVMKVFAERYLLEVPPEHPSYATAWRLRNLVERFVAIYPDHVPPTSLIREFIGGSGFEY